MDIPKSKQIHLLMLLGWYYPDSVGGTENYVWLLSRDLNTIGSEVTIIAPSKDETEKSYEFEWINVCRYPVSLSPSLEEIRGELGRSLYV